MRRTALLSVNLWRQMLGVDKATVIESVGIDEEANAVVAHVRPRKVTKRRCGRCRGLGRRSRRRGRACRP